MALQAVVTPLHAGLRDLNLVNRVKDDALLGVVSRDLHHFAGRHPTDRDGVIEIDRPRVARTDARRLQAGLGEDHHLRRARDVEGVEHRRQVAPFWIEAQRHLAPVDLLL